MPGPAVPEAPRLAGARASRADERHSGLTARGIVAGSPAPRRSERGRTRRGARDPDRAPRWALL